MLDAVIEGVNKLGEEEEQVEGIKVLDMIWHTTINEMYKDLGPKVHGILDKDYDNNYEENDSKASNSNH